MSTDDYPPEVAPVRPGEELDWGAAERYIRDRIPDLGPLTSVLQFPNGSANLTYLLDFDGAPLVLRRPPFGHIAVGAHDMKREYRALSRLWRHFDKAPHAWILCEDDDVVGAQFLVSEYRSGQVIWGRAPENMAHHHDLGRRVGFAVVDALAELHLVDPVASDLADLGRPEGFVDRQLAGWMRRWEGASGGVDVALMDQVADRLLTSKPVTYRSSILHNDYKIDNCQFDPDDPDHVKSVFDWDMATIGDPLVDVGTLLNYWPDPSDEPGMEPVFPVGLDSFGLPTRAEIVSRYAEQTAMPMETIAWYEAFATWKTGVVLQQLYVRYLRGETTDERQAGKGARIASMAQRAMTILESSS